MHIDTQLSQINALIGFVQGIDTENPPNEEWIQELLRKTTAAAISVETLATLAMKSQRGESRALSIRIGDTDGVSTEPKK